MNVHLPEKILNAMNENDVKLNAHAHCHFLGMNVCVCLCIHVCASVSHDKWKSIRKPTQALN